MKKIALVKWSIDRTDGGLKVATSLANELSTMYEVHLLSMISTESNFFSLKQSVRYQNLSPKKISMSKNFLDAVKLLRNYLKEQNIDIIFGIGMSMNTVGVASTLGLKTKFVSCDHTNSIVDNDTKVKKVQRFVGAKFADKIITLTQEDRRNYIRKYGIAEDKIAYIYNWKEDVLSNVTYNSESTKLVTVGRFDIQKGYDYLVQVAKKVLNEKSDWTWDIYGSGNKDEVNKIRDLIIENDLQDKLFIKGLEKNQALIYGDKAIYVMTSRYEGLPLVLLEAQQYNLPIVSFRCPTGPNEIVEDGVNGYLVECYDTDKLSEKLLELMEDEVLRQSFSEHAKDNMDKFDKDKILKQWIELIETI
jgi:wefM